MQAVVMWQIQKEHFSIVSTGYPLCCEVYCPLPVTSLQHHAGLRDSPKSTPAEGYAKFGSLH